MGSDDGDKLHRILPPLRELLNIGSCCRLFLSSRGPRRPLKRHYFHKETLFVRFLCLLVLLIFLFLLFVVLLQFVAPAPELVWADTFTPRQAKYPSECSANDASRFYNCQNPSTTTASTVRVLACHRQWCNSLLGGHCEPCQGLGDRMRFLLGQVHHYMHTSSSFGENTNCQTRVQLDYPVNDVAILDSAVYQDPSKWWGYLFRYRSYPINAHNFALGNGPQAPSLRSASATTIRHEGQAVSPPNVLLSHFVPDQSIPTSYDPCYFHFLFQPTQSLQDDIDRHLMALRRTTETQIQYQPVSPSTTKILTIGIHFRTGDVPAFGISQFNDTRVNNAQLESAWIQMLTCADELEEQLVKEHQQQSSKLLLSRSSSPQVRLFLATDNVHLKQQLATGSTNTDHRRFIYTTDVIPQSSWGAFQGDRTAWLELYLLSQLDGLVVNLLPQHGYHGMAHRRSYFSLLAQNIGFIPQHHVKECDLGN